MRYRYWGAIGASIILGLIFVIAGLGKLLNQADFLTVIRADTFLTPTLAQVVAYVLPWIEIALGVFLILGISAKLAAIFSSVLIATFIANNSWLIAHGLAYKPCGCFGPFEKVLLGELSTMESLFLDIGMLVLVSIILYCPGHFLTTRPWFLRIGKRADSPSDREVA